MISRAIVSNMKLYFDILLYIFNLNFSENRFIINLLSEIIFYEISYEWKWKYFWIKVWNTGWIRSRDQTCLRISFIVIETIYFMFNTKKGENEEGQLDVCLVVVHFCNIYVSYTLFSYAMFKNVLFANACFFLYTFLSAILN